MKISLTPIKKEEYEILINLAEKYEYEFSQYSNVDVDVMGTFGCADWLQIYFSEQNYWPYFIKVEEKLAGFILICDDAFEGYHTDFIVDEFFIIYKYRGIGVGFNVVKQVLQLHRGSFGLSYSPRNGPAAAFWQKTISRITNDDFQLYTQNPHIIYPDGTEATIITFDFERGD